MPRSSDRPPRAKPQDAPTPIRYRHPDPATDAALDWFLRLREGGSPAEDAAFRRWRDADPRHAAACRRLAALCALPQMRLPAVPAAAAPANRNHRPRRLARLAAVAVLALGLWQAPDLWLRWQADAATARAQTRVLDLADGSRVRMNADTLLAVDLDDTHRRVRLLRGEAVFEVAHDRQRPFTVAAPHGSVVVTGTVFNVRVAGDGDHVALERGQVRLLAGDGAELPLAPGQGAVMSAGGIARTPAPVEAELAWTRGRLDLDDATLPEAVARIAPHMRGRVLVVPGAGRAARVSGSFRMAEPGAALDAIAAAAGARISHVPGGGAILY